VIDEEINAVNGSTIILSCGEGQYPILRLSQIAESVAKEKGETCFTSKDVLGNIHIEECANSEIVIDSLVFDFYRFNSNLFLQIFISIIEFLKFVQKSKLNF
jgi:hypothetical protein